MQICRVDVADFYNSSMRMAFCAKVAKGFEENGFIEVQGTGIEDYLKAADALTNQVFDLPESLLEEKYGLPGMQRQRGYTPRGVEQAVGFSKPDPKRHWMTASPEILAEGVDPLDARFGASLDVLEVPEFTPMMHKILELSLRNARILLEALQLYYKIDARVKPTDLTMASDSVLRTLVYDNDVPAGTILAEEHLDINLITLLASSQIAGLELFVKGEWQAIETTPGSVVANIGEMLVEVPGFTHLRPMLHRVVAGPRMADRRKVYAAFVHAKRNAWLDPERPETHVDTLFLRRIREIQQGKDRKP